MEEAGAGEHDSGWLITHLVPWGKGLQGISKVQEGLEAWGELVERGSCPELLFVRFAVEVDLKLQE